MRGTLISGSLLIAWLGIIPAYAGNTHYEVSKGKTRWDHPRVCGEHRPFLSKLTRALGSSPRMRGTRVYKIRQLFIFGIIPAYAGNTSIFQRPSSKRRDHPRVCGEHGGCCDGLLAQWGSSPRMRGTLKMYTIEDMNVGIIPAYAGNTASRACSSGMARDHPRVCGEHQLYTSSQFAHKGSSPRMRGTPISFCVCVITPGIIPAYAGNTF